MTDKSAENLSVLTDGECPQRELTFTLRRLAGDDDLKARWQRYQLIGDAMRGELPESIDLGLADRVHQCLQNEEKKSSPKATTQKIKSWYKPVTGFALAASVTALTFVNFQPDNDEFPEIPRQFTTLTEPQTPMETRLSKYMQDHRFASLNSAPGMMSYVRMVGQQQPAMP